jgi:hypothetical protein
MGGGFTIDNPNVICTFGCVSSFKTAKNVGIPNTLYRASNLNMVRCFLVE